MRVGLLADTHDRLPAIAELIRQMASQGVTMVLHAGDFCAPFALNPIRESGVALAGVFGRNDGDREGLRAAASLGVGNEIYESPHSFEMSGQRVLLVHDLGEVNDRSVESHSVVVHGCSHRQEVLRRDDVLLVNPGEACGWLTGLPSAAILDLVTKQVELINLDTTQWK